MECTNLLLQLQWDLWKGYHYNGNSKASYYKNDFPETTAKQISLYQTSNLSCEDDTPYFKYRRKVDTEPSGGQVLPPLPPVFIDITVGTLTTPHVVYWLPHEGHYNKTRNSRRWLRIKRVKLNCLRVGFFSIRLICFRNEVNLSYNVFLYYIYYITLTFKMKWLSVFLEDTISKRFITVILLKIERVVQTHSNRREGKTR